jgi:hypothetical protein
MILSILGYFLVVVLSAFGLAVLIVEKGDEWPLSIVVDKLAIFLAFFSERWVSVLDCIVCAAFWCALFCELFLCFIGAGYFLWPLTGFAAAGLSWFVLEFLRSLDGKNGVQ